EDGSGISAMKLYLTNNLIIRPYFDIEQVTYPDAMVLQAWNNLFLGGSLWFANYSVTGTWLARDNLFDKSYIGYSYSIPNSYNAYLVNSNRLASSSGNDKILNTSPVYLTGSLGSYYYSTTDNNLSTLINAGSRTPTAAGLYHHTVKTSNEKEGDDPSSTTVDIGFHYVAVDAN